MNGIDELFNEKSGQANPERIVIKGKRSANGYHNKAADFARAGLYQNAAEVIAEGLEKFPSNIDLIADALAYCEGKFAANCFLQLRALSYEQWNWRAFGFATDYLVEEMLPKRSDDKYRETIFEIAIEIADKAIEYLPTDERSYKCKADVLLARRKGDDFDRAMEIFDDVVLQRHSEGFDGTPERPVFPVPQCATNYADIMLERGEYDKVGTIASIGILSTAQEQPSSRMGYFYYLRALAADAQLHVDLINGDDVFSQKERVFAILSDYKIASETLQGSPAVYENNIHNRSVALRISAGIDELDSDFDSDMAKMFAASRLASLIENRDKSDK